MESSGFFMTWETLIDEKLYRCTKKTFLRLLTGKNTEGRSSIVDDGGPVGEHVDFKACPSI